MARLSTKLKLYAKDNGKTINFKPEGNVKLEDNGLGPYIKSWNVSGLAEPTDEQIASYENDGNIVERNGQVDSTRRSQYGTWQEQMEMIYKDQKEGTSTFKEHCDKVRTDNPKE